MIAQLRAREAQTLALRWLLQHGWLAEGETIRSVTVWPEQPGKVHAVVETTERYLLFLGDELQAIFPL